QVDAPLLVLEAGAWPRFIGPIPPCRASREALATGYAAIRSVGYSGWALTTFTGYRMTVELLPDEAIIRRVGVVAKATAAEVRVPLDALTEVRVKDATPMVNGLLQFVLADAPSPPKPAPSDPYTVVFRRRTRDEIDEL